MTEGSSARVFVCPPGGEPPRIVSVSGARNRSAALPTVLFALMLVAGWLAIADPSAFVWSATASGFSALGCWCVCAVRREDQISPDSAWDGFFTRLRRAVRDLPEGKPIADAVLRRSLDVLVPFCAAGVLFCLLQVWVSSRITITGAARTVLRLEQAAIWLRGVNPVTRSLLKVPGRVDAAVVIALTLLSMSVPVLANVSKWWSTGMRWASRAYVLVTLLASVTFFGAQEGEWTRASVARINTEIRAIRAAYGDAEEAVARTLSDAAAVRGAHATPAVITWEHANAALEEAEALKTRAETIWPNPDSRLERELTRTRSFPGGAPRTAPAAEEQRPTNRSEEAPAADSEWRAETAIGLKSEAARLSREIRRTSGSKIVDPVVEKTSDQVYAEVVGRGVKAALQHWGINDELAALVLDPILHTPAKEWLKTKLKGIAGDVLARRRLLREAEAEMRQQARDLLTAARAGRRALEPFAQELEAYARQTAAVRDLAQAEYGIAVARRYEDTLRRFGEEFARAYGRDTDARALLATLREKAARVGDAEDRQALVERWSGDLFTQETLQHLEAFEGHETGSHHAAAIARAVVQHALRGEAEGRWGQLRANAEAIFAQSRYPESTKELALAHVRRWHRRKVQLAPAVAAEATSPEDLPDAWERAFFRYFREDPQKAVIWAYLVIAKDETIGMFKPWGATPADGMDYYLRHTAAGTAREWGEIASKESVAAMNDLLCGKK